MHSARRSYDRKDISTGTNFSSVNYGIKLFSIDLQHVEFTSGAEFKVANPSLHPTAVHSPSPRRNKKQSPELSMCSVSWSDTNSNSKVEPPMELMLHLVRKKKSAHLLNLVMRTPVKTKEQSTVLFD
jgi:hypothetical protein